MELLTDVRDLSRIGYGFMASKALFAALDLDLFTLLARQPSTLDDLAAAAGIRYFATGGLGGIGLAAMPTRCARVHRIVVAQVRHRLNVGQAAHDRTWGPTGPCRYMTAVKASGISSTPKSSTMPVSTPST